MKNSLYIYQNGELSRKDNTLRFTGEEGGKKDIPVNSISEIYFWPYLRSEFIALGWQFTLEITPWAM